MTLIKRPVPIDCGMMHNAVVCAKPAPVTGQATENWTDVPNHTRFTVPDVPKLVPEIVMTVPPDVGPARGEIDEMVGGAYDSDDALDDWPATRTTTAWLAP